MLFFGLTQAQNILFNAEGGSPDPSAFLEVRSTTQGFLGPRMNESQRLGIVNPAQGLLVFQIDGTIGFYFYNGSAWDTLGGATTVTNVSNVTNVTNSGIAIIRDIKSGGSNGGTFTSGVWVQRDLNDIDGDLSFVSLGTNEFKLDSGTYAITIYTPAYEVKTHQCRLYNVTTAAVEAYGNVAYADKFSQSLLTTIVSVTNSSETFRIEHRCSDTVGGKGLGEGVNWGDNTFTQVKIEKL
tara:strand:- start:6173 stop:6889 length:717 start_codon:yes stop_codon:yes gene_type:complete